MLFYRKKGSQKAKIKEMIKAIKTAINLKSILALKIKYPNIFAKNIPQKAPIMLAKRLMIKYSQAKSLKISLFLAPKAKRKAISFLRENIIELRVVFTLVVTMIKTTSMIKNIKAFILSKTRPSLKDTDEIGFALMLSLLIFFVLYLSHQNSHKQPH